MHNDLRTVPIVTVLYDRYYKDMPIERTWRMPSSSESLAQYVYAARKARGRTWDDLVRVTGLSQSTIRKIEDGRTSNPGIFTLLQIWEALDLPVEAFRTLATGPGPAGSVAGGGGL